MSIPSIKGKPVLSDADAETVAKSFKTAFKGIGTDEKRVIKEMLNLNNAQRQIVKEKYKNLYGKTLEEDLKDELKGDFEDICVALLLPRFEFEAKEIKKAMQGAGTRDNIVIDLLCSKESAEIEELKKTYKALFNSDFEEDIKGEAEGPLERLYRSIATGDRPTGTSVDQALADAEAKELYDAGEGQVGTEEGTLVRILGSRSFAQLKATFDSYKNLFSKDIVDSIKTETTGDFEEALVAIVEVVRNKPAYFAKRLYRVMQGPGVKDKELIAILVSRCEIDMINIRQEYKNIYNRSLTDDLKAELNGDFEDIVLQLIGKIRS